MSSEKGELDPKRYEKIDDVNRRSWYANDRYRPFEVTMSVHSAGSERTVNDDTTFEQKLARATSRVILGGNMSVIRQPDGKVPYGPREFLDTDRGEARPMTDDERYQDAIDNMTKHFTEIGVNMAQVKLLNPERDYTTPLTVVNADEDPAVFDGVSPARLEKSGDFVYSYNPDVVLAVRPADCPIAVISAETPKGSVGILVHFAWLGAANGQFDDMERELAALDIDPTTMRVYITPGGHAETFRFKGYKPGGAKPQPEKGLLYKDIDSVEDEDGEDVYTFGIDTPNAVYEKFLSLGLDPTQVFLDTTDTTSPKSGYASHSRAFNFNEDNVRDLVVVRFEDLSKRVASNPERPTPPEIQKEITPLGVVYVDFDGNRQHGTIEVNKAIAADVEAFFEEALRINYPIERVVKSSDPEFGWDDDKLMDANTSSGFNYRLIKNTDKPSLHGLGRAFDINTRINPFIRWDGPTGEKEVDPAGAEYDPAVEGTLTEYHHLVVFMKSRGWTWGGDWQRDDRPGMPSRTDYQHFEKPL